MHLIGIEVDAFLLKFLQQRLYGLVLLGGEGHHDFLYAESARDIVDSLQTQQHQHRARQGQCIESGTGRHADGARHPQAGSRRKPAHHMLLEDDGAGSDEADTRHYLCGDT